MKMLLALAIVLVAILIAFPFLWYRRRKIDAYVNRWAQENGYELIKYRERTFTPFTLSFKKSRSQEVVLVEIKEDSGESKKGWLILGDYYAGLFTYAASCEWID